MMAFHQLTKEDEDNWFEDMLANLDPKRKSRWFRFLNNIFFPMLVSALILPFWPLLVLLKVKQIICGEPDSRSLDEPEFSVTREDLQLQLSLQEIEQQEIVFDPLGAVPNVPFGHLNAAWKEFCERMNPHDHLWSFTAHRTSTWGSKEIRQGYVIVCGEDIGPNFLTVYKDIIEDTDQDTVSGKKRRNSIFRFGFGIKAN